MCGICGIIRNNEQVLSEEIEAMKSMLVHRGPDDEGTFLSTAKLPYKTTYIGLGHRRLSIIDLSANAKQPMSNENQQIWLTYNGEIYNFIELKDQLISFGHIFKTRSDTEVIIHAYEQWDITCLDRFNGMFAFALWDANKRQLFLARDRIGIKPLYYHHNNDTFIFASELKALLQIKDIPRQLDYQSISDYFSWGFIPAPKTIFRHIKKLLPAHYLLFNEKGLTYRRYWNVRKFSGNSQTQQPERYQNQVRNILADSVKKRMISDVPLGTFLSGGIDSSTIVALMGNNSVQPTKTFSIGFNSQEYTSELKYANIVAKTYATEHHERILSTEKLLELIPKLVWFMDEPFADHSIVPTYLVSQLAKESVTVALSGDGADENFAGYPRRYLFTKRYSRYLTIPELFRGTVEGLSSKLLQLALLFMSSSNRKKKLSKLSSMLHTTGLMRIITLHNIVDTNLKKKLLHRDIQEQVNLMTTIFCDEHSNKSITGNILEQVLALDIENYLVNDILTKVDRMSMANSLEVRVPFLDHRLVELAATIPTTLKINNNTTKYIIKNAFCDLLPQAIINRKKQGFGIPVKLWMQKDLAKFTRQILLDPSVKKGHMLNLKTLENMIKATSAGKCNYARELWALLMLELWRREFLY